MYVVCLAMNMLKCYLGNVDVMWHTGVCGMVVARDVGVLSASCLQLSQSVTC